MRRYCTSQVNLTFLAYYPITSSLLDVNQGFGEQVSAKRLGLFLLCGVLAYVILRVGVSFLPDPPQYVHLRQVKQHIDGIRPAWNLFRSTNSGFEEVQFYPESRADGLFGVRGFLTSAVQVARVVQFVESSHPPRPLYTNQLRVVDGETFADLRGTFSEPDATNSHPPRHD